VLHFPVSRVVAISRVAAKARQLKRIHATLTDQVFARQISRTSARFPELNSWTQHSFISMVSPSPWAALS
jgi:hypothetical protein